MVPKLNPDTKWTFQDILAHQGPLAPTDSDYNGSCYNITVLWETGEITSEPLSLISKDAPVPCAAYAKQHNLLDEPGWKHLNKDKYFTDAPTLTSPVA